MNTRISLWPAPLTTLLAATLAALAACTRAPPRDTDTDAGTVSASRQHLLRRAHVEGLIFDPEVADSVRALAVRRRNAPAAERDALERQFAAWLDGWAARNPLRAERAAEHARQLPGFREAIDPATGRVNYAAGGAPPR